MCHADESLASYLGTIVPKVQAKCIQPACGDPATYHLKTFLHGCMRVTLSVTVLPNQELPGVERAQIWVWARPLNADSASAAGVRRVPLSSDASCISFGESIHRALSKKWGGDRMLSIVDSPVDSSHKES